MKESTYKTVSTYISKMKPRALAGGIALWTGMGKAVVIAIASDSEGGDDCFDGKILVLDKEIEKRPAGR